MILRCKQEIIRDYNNEQNRVTIEKTFEELMKLSREQKEEKKRYIREGFENDEQLSMFDVLMKDDLSKEDIRKLKKLSVDLLDKIKKLLATMDHPFDKAELLFFPPFFGIFLPLVVNPVLGSLT